jgi:hypothetical protein
MTAIIYRPRSRAEVVRLLAEREEIEERAPIVVNNGTIETSNAIGAREMQAAYRDWNSGARERPLRWQDRAVIGIVTTAGCVLWLLEIARMARGVWWR